MKVEEQFQLLVDNQRDNFPELHEMLSQILVGGKVIRPTLTLLSGKFYEYDLKRLLPMAIASELLHIATLVHDDAVDKASIRRGRPTINKIWGLERAVILGDYLFAQAGEFAAATNNLRVVRLFAQTLGTISRAELRQGFSAFNLKQTYEEYIERIAGKTAALFAMATESGAVLSRAPEEAIQGLKEYGYNLGIAFQIVDDILDFVSTEAAMGKPVGSDLAQGTVTLPSLLLMQRYPEDNPVKRIFNNEGGKQQNIKKAIEIICNSGIIEECYSTASDYSNKACRNLNILPDNPSRQALLGLADYVVQRKK
ncbi:MAG: polyprenyl synthetase family protein [Dehalococcoidales bacterium]|nr:polyprenyl synthetase family protein [Dehalococcoidales bacterium]